LFSQLTLYWNLVWMKKVIEISISIKWRIFLEVIILNKIKLIKIFLYLKRKKWFLILFKEFIWNNLFIFSYEYLCGKYLGEFMKLFDDNSYYEEWR